ncbi:hypothetical protein ABZ297_12545 [Nonomuraea sp. NPDC005983]|uniref:hypothetical protein n=1 Tax=Nonomuraea sp. NPDC005983 TaxID=3155595 RepID=UPI0033BF43B3
MYPAEMEVMAKGTWRLLREALRYLSLSSSEQIEWIDSVEVGADELALQFDDGHLPSWLVREAGWLSDELAGHLEEVNQLSDLTDEGPAPWSPGGLRRHPTWERIRGLARDALNLMPPEPWIGSSTP